MFSRISRLVSLFNIYGFHAFRLIVNPILGRPIWIPLNGRRIWLNFDSATYYHLIHSTNKVKVLVEAIPTGLHGVILDGGANHGLFAFLASQKFPQTKIFALEPYQKVLPFLRKNVEHSQVEVVEKAIAVEDGEVTFFTVPSSDQVGSVVRELVEEFTNESTTIVESNVPAISLESFVKEQAISNIAVLKLDLQGLEFAILEHADEVLEITDCILLEVVLIEKTALQLLEKVKKFFPHHKILNPLPYGADIIFSKTPF